MKITAQSTSTSVPTLNATSGTALSGPAQNGIDFKSTLNSAAGTSSEDTNNAFRAQNKKAVAQSDERKDTPSKNATASSHEAVAPAAETVTPIVVLVLPLTDYSGNAALPSSDFMPESAGYQGAQAGIANGATPMPLPLPENGLNPEATIASATDSATPTIVAGTHEKDIREEAKAELPGIAVATDKADSEEGKMPASSNTHGSTRAQNEDRSDGETKSAEGDAKQSADTAARTQALDAGQLAGVSPVVQPAATPAIEFQGQATGSAGKIEGARNRAGMLGIGQANDKANSSVREKSGLPDVREKGTDDAGSANTAASDVFVSKRVNTGSEASASVNCDSNNSLAAVDSAAAQILSSANQGPQTNHEPLDGQGGAAASPSIHSQTGTAGQTAELQSASAVSSAQVIQSMHHSEMHLGMQSAEFGDISISTSMNHQALSAQISTEHSELSRALALHLPVIEAKLGTAYGVQVRVEVRDGGGASSYSGQGQQPRERSSSPGGSSPLRTGGGGMSSLAGPAATSIAASTSRLDIRI